MPKLPNKSTPTKSTRHSAKTKSYKTQNGKTIEFTSEEFSQIVEVFRMLQAQENKIRKQYEAHDTGEGDVRTRKSSKIANQSCYAGGNDE